VVGVVGAVRDRGPAAPPSTQGIAYFPLSQVPERAVYLALRTKSPQPARVANAVRQHVLAVDPDQPVGGVQTMEQRVAQVLARPRLPAVLPAWFGGAPPR